MFMNCKTAFAYKGGLFMLSKSSTRFNSARKLTGKKPPLIPQKRENSSPLGRLGGAPLSYFRTRFNFFIRCNNSQRTICIFSTKYHSLRFDTT